MLATFIDSLFLYLLLVLFALQHPYSLAFATALCGVYAVTRGSSFLIFKNDLIWVVLIMAVLMAVIFIRNDHRFHVTFYVLSTAFSFYSAKQLASFSLGHVKKCLELTFWFSVICVVIAASLYLGSPEPLGEIISGSSTNGIPSYFIVLQIAFSVAFFLESGRLPILSSIMTLLVAVLGVGRGSIIVSGLIVVVSVLFDVSILKNKKLRQIIFSFFGFFVLLMVLIGIFLYIRPELIESSLAGNKWSWGLLDPPRAQMAVDYWGKLDGLSIFFGSNYEGTSIDRFYGGNPHSAYIRLHSFFGLPGIFLVFLSPFLILFSNKSIRSRGVVGVLTLLVLVRGVTEPVVFPTVLDFFYFLSFFLFWKHAPVRQVMVQCD